MKLVYNINSKVILKCNSSNNSIFDLKENEEEIVMDNLCYSNNILNYKLKSIEPLELELLPKLQLIYNSKVKLNDELKISVNIVDDNYNIIDLNDSVILYIGNDFNKEIININIENGQKIIYKTFTKLGFTNLWLEVNQYNRQTQYIKYNKSLLEVINE